MHRLALACADDAGFRVGDVLGKEPVLLGFLAEQRQGTLVAGKRGEPRVDEGLPEVRVESDVPELARTRAVGDISVTAVAIAGPARVGGHRLVAGPQAHADIVEHTRDVLGVAARQVRRLGWARKGQRIIVVSGRPLGTSGTTNTLVLHTV